jgi:hypothetical protein
MSTKITVRQELRWKISLSSPGGPAVRARYAPGHVGELTQHIPFEMVDDALTATNRTRKRVRDLPSRVVVYLLIAAGLFTELGYQQVWARLVAGIEGIPVAAPSSSALAQARRRVGVAPLAALFGLLAGLTTSQDP